MVNGTAQAVRVAHSSDKVRVRLVVVPLTGDRHGDLVQAQEIPVVAEPALVVLGRGDKVQKQLAVKAEVMAKAEVEPALVVLVRGDKVQEQLVAKAEVMAKAEAMVKGLVPKAVSLDGDKRAQVVRADPDRGVFNLVKEQEPELVQLPVKAA